MEKSHLDEKPERTWMEAVSRWLLESQHKKSLKDDKIHLRWLDRHLKHFMLNKISRDLIDSLAEERLKDNVKPATVNRMLEIIRAILRKAVREWEWIDRAPVIRMRQEDTKRIRWLTQNDVEKLIHELPEHLADMMLFTLATGLRKSNVSGMQWCDVDLVKKHALIHPDQAKTKKLAPLCL